MHTVEGKEELRESSKHLQQDFSNTARPLISFLHSSDSFLLVSHEQDIDPTRLFFSLLFLLLYSLFASANSPFHIQPQESWKSNKIKRPHLMSQVGQYVSEISNL